MYTGSSHALSLLGFSTGLPTIVVGFFFSGLSIGNYPLQTRFSAKSTWATAHSASTSKSGTVGRPGGIRSSNATRLVISTTRTSTTSLPLPEARVSKDGWSPTLQAQSSIGCLLGITLLVIIAIVVATLAVERSMHRSRAMSDPTDTSSSRTRSNAHSGFAPTPSGHLPVSRRSGGSGGGRNPRLPQDNATAPGSSTPIKVESPQPPQLSFSTSGSPGGGDGGDGSSATEPANDARRPKRWTWSRVFFGPWGFVLGFLTGLAVHPVLAKIRGRKRATPVLVSLEDIAAPGPAFALTPSSTRFRSRMKPTECANIIPLNARPRASSRPSQTDKRGSFQQAKVNLNPLDVLREGIQARVLYVVGTFLFSVSPVFCLMWHLFNQLESAGDSQTATPASNVSDNDFTADIADDVDLVDKAGSDSDVGPSDYVLVNVLAETAIGADRPLEAHVEDNVARSDVVKDLDVADHIDVVEYAGNTEHSFPLKDVCETFQPSETRAFDTIQALQVTNLEITHNTHPIFEATSVAAPSVVCPEPEIIYETTGSTDRELYAPSSSGAFPETTLPKNVGKGNGRAIDNEVSGTTAPTPFDDTLSHGASPMRKGKDKARAVEFDVTSTTGISELKLGHANLPMKPSPRSSGLSDSRWAPRAASSSGSGSNGRQNQQPGNTTRSAGAPSTSSTVPPPPPSTRRVPQDDGGVGSSSWAHVPVEVSSPSAGADSLQNRRSAARNSGAGRNSDRNPANRDRTHRGSPGQQSSQNLRSTPSGYGTSVGSISAGARTSPTSDRMSQGSSGYQSSSVLPPTSNRGGRSQNNTTTAQGTNAATSTSASSNQARNSVYDRSGFRRNKQRNQGMNSNSRPADEIDPIESRLEELNRAIFENYSNPVENKALTTHSKKHSLNPAALSFQPILQVIGANNIPTEASSPDAYPTLERPPSPVRDVFSVFPHLDLRRPESEKSSTSSRRLRDRRPHRTRSCSDIWEVDIDIEELEDE